MAKKHVITILKPTYLEKTDRPAQHSTQGIMAVTTGFVSIYKTIFNF
jgi:hypothetical protein